MSKFVKLTLIQTNTTYPINATPVWVNMDHVRYMYHEKGHAELRPHTTLVFSDGNPKQFVDGYITVSDLTDRMPL